MKERKTAPGPVLVGVVGGTLALLAALGGSIWWTRHHKQPEPVEQAAAAPPDAPAPAQPEPPPAPEPAPEATNPDAPMTNDDVIQMIQAKVSPDNIIAAIRTSKDLQFKINAKELTRLTQAGVPKSVIDVMIDPKKAAQAGAPTPTPAHSTPKQTPKATPAAPATPQITNAQVTPPQPQQPASPAPGAAQQTGQQAAAQQAAVQPPPSGALPGGAAAKAATTAKAPSALTAITIADGTGFRIVLAQDIPADAKKDTPVKFTVAANLLVQGDKVAIRQGAVVTGAVVDEKKKGGPFGIGGKSMTFKLLKVEAVDRMLDVRAEPTKGSDHSVDSSVKGKVKSSDAVAAPAGSEYIAYVDGDQTVTVGK